ncbi:MAG: anaerobic ribonucleoside-triphosphate reductase [Christensenellales bacterium]
MFYDRYRSLGLSDERAQEEAMKDIVNDFEQGFQGWEYKFNTVASSRGDYPFITMTLGLGQTRMAKLASKLFLKVHAGGQGKKNNKKPVLFPSSSFSMTKTCMVRASRWKTSLRRASTAPPRRCIRIGSV